MKKWLKLALVMLPITTMTGCATIIYGDTTDVSITSTPSNAKITVKNNKGDVVFKGTTPTVVTLKTSDGYFRREHYQITFKHKKYPSKTIDLVARFNGVSVLGGALGLFVIDPLTGASFRLPKHVNADLGDKHSLRIIDINELSDEQRALLVRID